MTSTNRGKEALYVTSAANREMGAQERDRVTHGPLEMRSPVKIEVPEGVVPHLGAGAKDYRRLLDRHRG